MKHFGMFLGLLPGAALAQQSAWGQCGGINWTGSTTCVSGYKCVESSAWYSQCVPGTATGTTTTVNTPQSTKQSSTVTKATTTTTVRVSSAATTTVAVKTTTTPGSSTATGFAKAVGSQFEVDGVLGYQPGTNCYWCGFLTSNADVDHVFSNMASAKLKIVRVWGFNDVNSIPGSGSVWYQYLSASGSQINTGANGLQRLDAVVASAEKYNLKLIVNFVNNWSDYGGMPAYVKAFGGTASSWYTNSAAQAQYRKYIQAVVSRYSNSKAIFAWELANEPRCSGCDTSVMFNWATSVSQYIKSLDSNHMVTLGDEGFGVLAGGDSSYPFTNGAGGYNWQSNLAIPTLDFATIHLYPDSWGQPLTWGTSWVTTHGNACAKANKPCLLEEYGGDNSCPNENPWQKAAVDNKGFGGDLFWQYGDTLPSCNCQTAQDGNTVYFKQGNWDCMVTDHLSYIKSSGR